MACLRYQNCEAATTNLHESWLSRLASWLGWHSWIWGSGPYLITHTSCKLSGTLDRVPEQATLDPHPPHPQTKQNESGFACAMVIGRDELISAKLPCKNPDLPPRPQLWCVYLQKIPLQLYKCCFQVDLYIRIQAGWIPPFGGPCHPSSPLLPLCPPSLPLLTPVDIIKIRKGTHTCERQSTGLNAILRGLNTAWIKPYYGKIGILERNAKATSPVLSIALKYIVLLIFLIHSSLIWINATGVESPWALNRISVKPYELPFKYVIDLQGEMDSHKVVVGPVRNNYGCCSCFHRVWKFGLLLCEMVESCWYHAT